MSAPYRNHAIHPTRSLQDETPEGTSAPGEASSNPPPESGSSRCEELFRDEMRMIAEDIARMKREISRLRPGEIRHSHIPEVGRELDAIVEATEGATHEIMELAETIMEGDASGADSYKAFVDEKLIGIFEACSFQDITGQRIGKVVETLQLIERRVSHFMEQLEAHDLLDGEEIGERPEEETERERRKRDLILHGPQLGGEGVNQAEVDDFFENGSSQNDIDRLFE